MPPKKTNRLRPLKQELKVGDIVAVSAYREHLPPSVITHVIEYGVGKRAHKRYALGTRMGFGHLYERKDLEKIEDVAAFINAQGELQ